MFLEPCKNNKRDAVCSFVFCWKSLFVLRQPLKKSYFEEWGQGRILLLTAGLRIMDWRIRVIILWFGELFWFAVLNYLGFQHSTVNHARHFKDPITGVHSNTIEGRLFSLSMLFYEIVCKFRWFCVKRTLPRSGAYELES